MSRSVPGRDVQHFKEGGQLCGLHLLHLYCIAYKDTIIHDPTNSVQYTSVYNIPNPRSSSLFPPSGCLGCLLQPTVAQSQFQKTQLALQHPPLPGSFLHYSGQLFYSQAPELLLVYLLLPDWSLAGLLVLSQLGQLPSKQILLTPQLVCLLDEVLLE